MTKRITFEIRTMIFGEITTIEQYRVGISNTYAIIIQLYINIYNTAQCYFNVVFLFTVRYWDSFLFFSINFISHSFIHNIYAIYQIKIIEVIYPINNIEIIDLINKMKNIRSSKNYLEKSSYEWITQTYTHKCHYSIVYLCFCYLLIVWCEFVNMYWGLLLFFISLTPTTTLSQFIEWTILKLFTVKV